MIRAAPYLTEKAARVDGVSAGLPSIVLSQADTVGNAICHGVATHDIEDQTVGYIIALGNVSSLDTSAWSPGDRLFVSATVAGDLTNIEQTILSPVALVLESDVSNGEIFSRPVGLANITALAQAAIDAGSPTQ